MKKKITIVDYGSGNLLSAKQSLLKVISLKNIDADIEISNNPKIPHELDQPANPSFDEIELKFAND